MKQTLSAKREVNIGKRVVFIYKEKYVKDFIKAILKHKVYVFRDEEYIKVSNIIKEAGEELVE